MSSIADTQLALKDEQIASLEEKLVQALDEATVSKVSLEEKLVQALDEARVSEVRLEEKLAQMSLELASSKAFEDEHRVKISLEFASSKALEDENRSKRRADVNEKLVQMSLELASSKASEDEHRSKRRALNVLLKEKLAKISLELALSQALENEHRLLRHAQFSSQEAALRHLASENNYAPNTAVNNGGAFTRNKTCPVFSQSSVPSPSVPRGMNEKQYLNIGRWSSALELSQPSRHSRNTTSLDKKHIRGMLGLNKKTVAADMRKGSRYLQSSPGPLLSGVSFPVSFNDVLDCISDKATGGPSINNANEEWPQF